MGGTAESNFVPTQFLGRPDQEFYGWRILFAVPLLFSLFQLLLLPWAPRSPRFLFIKRNNHEAARIGRCGQDHMTIM